MKFLILGGTGMAGHMIAMYLCEQNHDVTVFSRGKFAYCSNLNGDVTDTRLLADVIDAGKYDFVVNCVGMLNQECERKKKEAVYVNSYLPHFLADLTKNMKTNVIHLSTDCVFSGKKGNYHEDSFCDSETFYDRTKALGELNDEKNLTFRCSIVGPDMKKEGIGLMNWFMKQEKEIYGYRYAIWTGVTTLTLAKAIEAAAKENLKGLYHLVNNQTISKHDLLGLFNCYLRNNEIKILPSDTVKVNKSLKNTREDFSFCVPSYKQMVIEIKEWIDEHRQIYSHYF